MAPRWAPRFSCGPAGRALQRRKGLTRVWRRRRPSCAEGGASGALAVLAVAEPEFRRTARRVSLCADDAEDAFQRAVEILLTKAPERPPNALVAWMQVVTRREALAVRRARERILAAWRDDGNELFDAAAVRAAGTDGARRAPRRRRGRGPSPR